MNRSKQIALCAMMAALTFCATFFLAFPIAPGGGYLNFGDGVLLAGTWLLGPVLGSLSAGIGSALADLLGGYTVYVLPTLIIKSGMALIAYLPYRLLAHKQTLVARLLGAVAAELVMIGGYLAVDSVLYGFPTACLNLPQQCMQAVFGIILSVLLSALLSRLSKFAK